jgi:hypothetical protein
MSTIKPLRLTAAATAAVFGGVCAAAERPTVIVTVENLAPELGTFQTPVWVGFHAGEFDSYDGGELASFLPILGSPAIERIAEDGNAGPLSDDFDVVVPDGVQGVVASNGPIPPLGPGQSVSRLFDVDPSLHRYFSYVSMVIPSNDAFIANGSATAHAIFDGDGAFVGESFVVSGVDVNDAGTELNDEVPEHTAFFGQMMPDTGVDEEMVIMAHPGFLPAGSGGILDDPMFEDADFLAKGYDVLAVSFTYFDAAAPARFRGGVDAEQQVGEVESDAFGRVAATSLESGTVLDVRVKGRQLSGPVVAAHLHVAPAGQNGPVVVDLTDAIEVTGDGSMQIVVDITADDIGGPLGDTDDPFGNLLAELVTGGVYVNLHTEAYPSGEIRGQLLLR